MIGHPLPRFEDARLVIGKGRYTDDFNEPGQLFAAFHRSPHAHAVIRSIDVQAALAAPGVVAVLTGHDYVGDGFQGIEHVPNPADAIEFARPSFQNSLTGSVFSSLHLPLPIDKTRHVGEPLVMVIADTAARARDAAELVDIDFETLDAVVTADDAIQEGAPQVWEGAPGNLCFQVEIGDKAAVAKAFADAPCIIRREFRNSRIVNCQMEPRSAIGVYDAAADSYKLISGSQGAVRQKMGLVGALKTVPAKVRVICPDVGGGFGPRSSLNVEQLAVLWAARRVGAPVKWTSDRGEAFLGDYQGRDNIIRASMALSADGRILAIDHEWLGNVGAHTVSYVPMSNGARILATVYHVPASMLKISALLTNTVSTAPYRGAGRPEATHVMERLLDMAALELGLPRDEIRRRNLVPHDALPYRSVTGLNYDSGDFLGNMERALAMSKWSSFEERRAESKRRGMLRGIGLANYIESPVGAPKERVEMIVLADGTIDVVAGTQSTGQGHETTFAQVIASHLGVDATCMRLRTGDTAFVSVGGGSHSDRTMRLGGALLMQASNKLVEQGKAVAAVLLDAAPEHVQFHGGFDMESRHDEATGRSTSSATQATGYFDNRKPGSRTVSIFDVARFLDQNGMPHDASIRKLDAVAEFNGRMSAHPTGSAVCELEIDPETGDAHMLEYTSVDDVGRPINPLIIEGQVHGGLAQGIGQAFYETHRVDRETGQVLSGSYMDYGVPRAGDLPPLHIALTEDRTKGNPLSVKGGGESGITPATATIFNALADALKDISTKELEMPATPSVVWEFIQKHKKTGDIT